MESKIEIFVRLGERLRHFGKDERSLSVLQAAVEANDWYKAEDILRSVDAICEEYLNREKLQRWLEAYDTDVEPGRVAIVMAGNIPLVGFFDLMCVLLCGHTALVKPSSKDRVLMGYVISLLREIDVSIPIEEYDDSTTIDMSIATGGDDAARYFRSRYADVLLLVRGSRHSVAVLSGEESAEQIAALQQDIFSYSGLGCRNVSLVLLPCGVELCLQPPVMCQMYRGNYRHHKALMQMLDAKFRDFGECIAVEQWAFSNTLSQINYAFYDSLAQVERWLSEQEEVLQCVVSDVVNHPRRVGFGRAQYPTLSDYADGVDVIEFLTQ